MRRFTAKLLLYLGLVAALQALVASALRPRFSRAARALDGATDVVFFGDSTDYFCDPGDVDRRPTHELLSRALDGRRVTPLVSGAYHMPVFAAHARRIAASGARPRAAVVTINLRSFSPMWYMRPEWRFEARVRSVDPSNFIYYAILKPLTIFKMKLGVTEEEFLATPVRDGDDQIGTVGDFEEMGRRLGERPLSQDDRRDWISYYYLYRLREEHPLVGSLRVAVSSLREAGVAPIFYVTPVDHESATRWYGPKFRSRVAANVAVIQGALSDYGVQALDMSFDLGAGAFTYSSIPNEHLKERGRRHVARRLAEAIRGLSKGLGEGHGVPPRGGSPRDGAFRPADADALPVQDTPARRK